MAKLLNIFKMTDKNESKLVLPGETIAKVKDGFMA